MTPSARLWRFTRRYVLRYWPWYLSGVVFLVLTNALTVHIPVVMARGIDALQRPDGAAEALDAARGVGIMGLMVIGVRTLSRVLYFTPGRLAEFEIRSDVLANLLPQRQGFWARHAAGDIISRASNDITYLRVMVGFGTLQIVNVTAALGLTAVAMARLSPLLMLVSAAPVLLAWVGVQLAMRRMHALMTVNQQQLGAISDHVLAAVAGVRTVQGFNAAEAMLERLRARNQGYYDTNIELTWLRTGVLPLLGLAGGVSVYALVAVGGPLAARGELSAGELVAFVALLTNLLYPLRSLGWLVTVFQRGLISMERIDELLYAEPDRPEGPDAPAPPEGPPALTLRDLRFAYPDDPTGRLALDGVSVHIPAGAVVGVTGRTGSGKSTLLKLIARTWDPPAGALLVDGQDLRGLDLVAWRRRLAVVPQAPFLFSERLSHNIAMGEPDPQRLARAVADAALTPDLAALPAGLDTVVGERGITLSGGQRQRATLARALYRDFDLLLLDDTLSAVDQKTERALIEGLTRDKGGRRATTLIVSHRLSVMARADLVLVMDQGRLVDAGTHAELLSRPGPYLSAWEQQQGEEHAR